MRKLLLARTHQVFTKCHYLITMKTYMCFLRVNSQSVDHIEALSVLLIKENTVIKQGLWVSDVV